MAKAMPSLLHDVLLQVSEPVRECLSEVEDTPSEGTAVSIKSFLESLLPQNSSPLVHDASEEALIHTKIRDFSLCCAAVASSGGSTHGLLSWIPKQLSELAVSAFQGISEAFFTSFDGKQSWRMRELGLDHRLMSDETKLAVELMFDVLPLLKERIKESSIGGLEVGDEVLAASARVPVAYAILAAHQFRWFVTQVGHPHLGMLVSLVIPCGLTALDHWSPEVKGQGMITFIHLVKHVNVAEIGLYEDVILDACCQNIVSDDEIWYLVVETSVLLVALLQQNNPRSPWFEKILNEMLGHLERQPKNKQRCILWLEHIEPLFHAMGLVILAHFSRIFPLLFQWMHVDDDQTVVLALKRLHTIIKITWIRNTPYVVRLVDELAVIYKEAATKRARDEIRRLILQILVLLQQCKGPQFEAAWDKYRDDPNLTTLGPSLCGRNSAMVV